MQEYLLTLTGVDPLVMHNDRLANPLDPYKQAISALTAKISKSDADHWAIARQEFDGGMHWDEQNGSFRVYVPARQPFASMLNAARTVRLGKKLSDSAILMAEDGGLRVPIVFDAPWSTKKAPAAEKALDLLWADEKFRDMRMVGVDNMGNKRRVLRTRPRFEGWSARLRVMLEESILEYRKFESIVTRAGRLCGIGEAPDGIRARYEVDIQKYRNGNS